MTAVTSFSNWYARTDPVTTTVTFESRPHLAQGSAETAYAVIHDGVIVGTIWSVLVSRTRHAWIWMPKGGVEGDVLTRTRWEAASRILTALRQGEAVR